MKTETFKKDGSPKSAEQYVAEHTVWRNSDVWNSKREYLIYDGVSTRYRIYVERNAEIGFGIQRCEELGEAGISDAHLDYEQFASDFIDTIGQELSLLQTNILIDTLTKFRDKWEAERQASIAHLSTDRT